MSTASEPETVVVTGALGGAGRWVVDRLAAEEYTIVGLDQRLPRTETPANTDFFAVDLADYGETTDLIAEADPDAVVHLAAIPDPTNHAGVRVFENNVSSTYNVLDAAGRAGARVTWASSESAYGFPFAEELLRPDAVPIDETHPFYPEDPYGVSKVAGEAIAARTTRRYGVPVVSIRPSWVQYPGDYALTTNREGTDLDAIEAMSPTDPPQGGAGNLWSYIDVRDLASMVTATLNTDIEGHEPYLCHAAENYLGIETSAIIEALYENAPTCTVDEDGSAFSTEKARSELGWTPEHAWREAMDAEVTGPTFE